MPTPWLPSYYLLFLYNFYLRLNAEWSAWLLVRSHFTMYMWCIYEIGFNFLTFWRGYKTTAISPILLYSMLGSAGYISMFYAITRATQHQANRHWKYCAFYTALRATYCDYKTRHQRRHIELNTYTHMLYDDTVYPTHSLPYTHLYVSGRLMTPLLWYFSTHATLDTASYDLYNFILISTRETINVMVALLLLHTMLLTPLWPANNATHEHHLNEIATRNNRGRTRFRENFNHHDYLFFWYIPWSKLDDTRTTELYALPPYADSWCTYHLDLHAEAVMHRDPWHSTFYLLKLLDYDHKTTPPIRRADSYQIECELTSALDTQY